MKTFKQITEDWQKDPDDPFKRPRSVTANGTRGGLTRIAQDEPGMVTGHRYFIKRTGANGIHNAGQEAHRGALAARVLEHYGVQTNGQKVAHVRLNDGKSKTPKPALVSEWNEDLVAAPHPVGNKHLWVHPKDMTHEQRVDYAKIDILGHAMNLGDTFTGHGARNGNIKLNKKTGRLHAVDIDEGFTHEHFLDAEHYQHNPQEIHYGDDDLRTLPEDRKSIRRHIFINHPEAYHEALHDLKVTHGSGAKQKALREHFDTHGPNLSHMKPPGEAIHTVWNNRLHKSMTSFDRLLLHPTPERLTQHGIE